MDKQLFSAAMQYIDDDMILAAMPASMQEVRVSNKKSEKTARIPSRKHLAIAASIAVLIFAVPTAYHFANPSETENGEDVQIANPITDYASLDEMNAAAGTDIKAAKADGVTSEAYSVIAGEEYDIADYRFTYNGTEYTIRAAVTTDSISGYYTANGTLEDECDYDEMIEQDGIWFVKWMNGNEQFILMGESASQSDFESVYEAVR